MRIGIMSGAVEGPDRSLEGLLALAKHVEDLGFATLWLAQIFGLDAITALSIVGRETRRIELGTAVVPSYPRHPLAIAQQALTAQVASGGRFTLGIGLSHQIVIENMLGLSFARPASHMREYLAVLAPLLRGEKAEFAGEEYRVSAALTVPDAGEVPVLIAALGRVMLGLAGSLSQGTITWMTGEKSVRSHVIPTITAAAREAGRPEPRVVVGLPVVLTDDPDGAREKVAQILQTYGFLPSYRTMLDREGAAGPADVAIVGDAMELRTRIDRLREIGATDLIAAVIPVEEGAMDRTLECLATLIPKVAE
jgi:5,10-methylenetetrahydromethanopterin reductase